VADLKLRTKTTVFLFALQVKAVCDSMSQLRGEYFCKNRFEKCRAKKKGGEKQMKDVSQQPV